MSMNDGGPAFPRQPVKVQEEGKSYTEYKGGQAGMTLRDWFAGMALPGLLAVRDERGRVAACELTPNEIAEQAYRQAGAMMAARE